MGGVEFTRDEVPTVATTSHAYAGFWLRAGAFAIDVLILIALELFLIIFFVMSDVQDLVLYFAIVYFVVGASMGGTPGKRLVGLRIVDSQGRVPGLIKGFVRTLVEGVACFVLFLGHFWMLWDKDKQTWHDKLARTYVIRV